MRESRTSGSVRGARGNSRPYRVSPVMSVYGTERTVLTSVPSGCYLGVSGPSQSEPFRVWHYSDPRRWLANARYRRGSRYVPGRAEATAQL